MAWPWVFLFTAAFDDLDIISRNGFALFAFAQIP